MTNKKEKKEFFEEEIKKFKQALKHIPWRLEIVKEGKLAIREGLRIEYSKMKELIDAGTLRIDDEKKKEAPDLEAIKAAVKLRAAYDQDSIHLENQLAEIDKEIEDVDKTETMKMEAGRQYLELLETCLKKVQ